MENFSKILELWCKYQSFNSLLTRYNVNSLNPNYRVMDWENVLYENVSQHAKSILQEIERLKEVTTFDDDKENIAFADSINRELNKLKPINSVNTYSSYNAWLRARQNPQNFDTYVNELSNLQNDILDNGSTYSDYIDKNCGVKVDIDTFYQKLKPTILSLKTSDYSNKEYSTSKNKVPSSYINAIMNRLGVDKNYTKVISHASSPMTINISNSEIHCYYNINEKNHVKRMASIYHELGHVLYEQKYSSNKKLSMSSISMHEAFAFLYEKHIFPNDFEFNEDLTLRKMSSKIDFSEYWNERRASPSRVHSDQVTYLYHLIIRHECEKMFFAGEDISKIADYFVQSLVDYGINATLTNSFLVDPHWSMGNFGYFPSYAIGQAIASQLVAIQPENYMTCAHELMNLGNQVDSSNPFEIYGISGIDSSYLSRHLLEKYG